MKIGYAVIAVVGLLSACGGDSTDSSTTAPPQEVALPNGPVVVFMGDSITQYWGGGAPAYPTIPITTLVPGAIDAGIAGQVTEQIQSRFAANVLANNPSVVVILGGTNDLALQESPNIDAISAMAQAAATQQRRACASSAELCRHRSYGWVRPSSRRPRQLLRSRASTRN